MARGQATEIKFTAGRIAELACEPGKSQLLFCDATAPELGLRVTPGGAKSFIYEARVDGRTLRFTIGDHRAWPVRDVRAEATRLKAMADNNPKSYRTRIKEI